MLSLDRLAPACLRGGEVGRGVVSVAEVAECLGFRDALLMSRAREAARWKQMIASEWRPSW
jgi:hypothetical protein